MRNCPRCLNTAVIEDGYCGHCRQCTMQALPVKRGTDSHQRMVSVGTSEILKYLSLVAIEHEEWPVSAIEVKQHLTPRCLDAIRELGSKLTAYANAKL